MTDEGTIEIITRALAKADTEFGPTVEVEWETFLTQAVERALDEAGLVVVGWLDIESAPKDGTHILVWVPAMHKHAIGYWHQPGNPEHKGMWCFSTGGGASRTVQYWMPLPASPNAPATT